MDSSTWIMTRSFQLKNSNSVIHKVKGQQQQQQRLGLATAAAVATDDATVQVISAASTTGRSRTSPVVMGEQAKKIDQISFGFLARFGWVTVYGGHASSVGGL